MKNLMVGVFLDFPKSVSLVHGDYLVQTVQKLMGSEQAIQADCSEHENAIEQLENFLRIQSNIQQIATYCSYVSMCFWLTVVIALIVWRKLRTQRSLLHLSTLSAW